MSTPIYCTRLFSNYFFKCTISTVVLSLFIWSFPLSSVARNCAVGEFNSFQPISIGGANDHHEYTYDWRYVQSPPSLDCTITAVNPSCNSTNGGYLANGSVTASGSGGSGTYTYSKDGITFQASGTFLGLAAGNYTVTVMDDIGSTSTCSTTLVEPSEVSCMIIGEDPTCNASNGGYTPNGSAMAMGLGGTGPYTFSIDGVNFQMSGIFNGLSVGSYTVTVKDANGCTSTCMTTLTQPTAVNCMLTGVNPTCNSSNGGYMANGSITATSTGGTGSKTYSINGGTTYQASSTFSGLAAGTYTVTVKDANGCTSTCMTTLIQPVAVSCNLTGTNPTCNSSNGGYMSNGSVTATSTGGTGTKTYSLDGGANYQASGTFGDLEAGTYTVIVKDANGCTSTCMTTLTQPIAVSCSLTGTNPTCNSSNGGYLVNGSVTATSAGGAGTKTYSIDGGATYQASGTFSGLAAGPYTVTVKDASGCTSTCMTTLTQPIAVSCNLTGVNPTCNSSNGGYMANGSITATSTGGTGTITYSLDGGATYQASGTFSDLGAGSYTVTVMDVNGCTSTCSTTLMEPMEVSCMLMGEDPTCNLDNGSIMAMGFGGTGPYSFSIDGVNFQMSGMFNDLAAGNYTVTVKDNNGCTSTCSTTLNSLTPVSCTIIDTNPSCNSSNGGYMANGSVTATGAGGSGTFTYSLDGITFQLSGTFGNLPAGNYTVTVKDANGCTSTCMSMLIEPTAVSCLTTGVNPSCNSANGGYMADGSVTASGTGGSGSYTYSIDGINFQSSGIFNGLAAGNYTVTVLDVNGCSSTCMETLTEPVKVSCVITGERPTCNSTNGGYLPNGRITATGSGGSGTFTYSLDGMTFQSSGTFLDLTAGSYTVTIMDANGCTSTCSITLMEPVEVGCMLSGENPTCNMANGSLMAMGFGGTGPYAFSIDGMTFQMSGIFNGLAAGNYTVTVKDVNNCTSVCTITLSDLNPVSCTTTGANPSCHSTNGGYMANGSITATGSGGSGTYTYSLDGITYQLSGTFGGLMAGNYTVTVKDANGCTSTCIRTLTEPIAVSCSSIGNNPSCNSMNGGYSADGSVTATGSGGAGTYMYSIDGINFQMSGTFSGLNAGQYTVTVRDANGCASTCMTTLMEPIDVTCTVTRVNPSCHSTNGGYVADGSFTAIGSGGNGAYMYSIDGINFQVSGTFSGLPAGSYTITTQDANGCASTCSITLIEPTAVSCAITGENPSCNSTNGSYLADGSITAIGSGGSGMYTYSLDGVVFQANGSFLGLASGNYTVTVMDDNGCTSTCSITLTEPMAVSCMLIGEDPTCNSINGGYTPNGSLMAMALGGTGPYTFSIDGLTFQMSGLFNSLSAGGYTVTVKDANGCTSTCTTMLLEPAAVSCTITGVNPSCNASNGGYTPNGSVTATGSGGSGQYSYSIDGITFQVSGTFDNLAAGTYTVVVKDANGCTSTCMRTLTQPIAVSCNLTGTNPTCNSSNGGYIANGSITATSTGGTGTITYSINGGTSYQASGTFSGLAAGTYTVIVKDANGCTSTCMRTLTQPTAVSCTLAGTNPTCNSSNGGYMVNGSVTATSTGGTGIKTYSIDGGTTYQSSGTFSGLAAGTYTVTVKDANGCTSTCMRTLTQPVAVSCSLTGTNPTCNSSNGGYMANGSITATSTGGTGTKRYSINGGTTYQASGTFSGLAAGNYTVTVRDANGCTSTCMRTLSEPSALSCSITGTNVSCNTSGTGAADALITGGVSPLTYLWSNGAITEDIMNLNPGTYTLTVTDANNCSSMCQVVIEGLICEINQTVCDENGLRGAAATVTGGLPPYIYMWSTGETTASIDGLIPGNYNVIVTDDNDCETMCDVIIDRCFSCDQECSTTFGILSGFEDCFTQYGFSQWGWTNGLLAEGNYSFDLYSEALMCDLNVGELVGEMLVSYAGNDVTVTYNLFGDYVLSVSSLYVGCDPIPTVNGTQTVSPSQYTYQQFHNNVTTYVYSVSVHNLPCEGIYIIGHAETCLPTDFFCSIASTSVNCNVRNNGTASASVNGGLPPYQYAWSTGETAINIANLVPGDYTLTVTDANECASVCEVRIQFPLMQTQQIGPFCQNDAPYDLTKIFSKAGSPENWSGPGVRDEIFYPSALVPGVYNIYYDDPIDCISVIQQIVVNPRCCPPDYAQVNGRMLIGIQSDTVNYETDGIIDSDQYVEATTTYDSRVEINLKPAFEVKLGTEFSAIIDGCP